MCTAAGYYNPRLLLGIEDLLAFAREFMAGSKRSVCCRQPVGGLKGWKPWRRVAVTPVLS